MLLGDKLDKGELLFGDNGVFRIGELFSPSTHSFNCFEVKDFLLCGTVGLFTNHFCNSSAL